MELTSPTTTRPAGRVGLQVVGVALQDPGGLAGVGVRSRRRARTSGGRMPSCSRKTSDMAVVVVLAGVDQADGRRRPDVLQGAEQGGHLHEVGPGGHDAVDHLRAAHPESDLARVCRIAGRARGAAEGGAGGGEQVGSAGIGRGTAGAGGGRGRRRRSARWPLSWPRQRVVRRATGSPAYSSRRAGSRRSRRRGRRRRARPAPWTNGPVAAGGVEQAWRRRRSAVAQGEGAAVGRRHCRALPVGNAAARPGPETGRAAVQVGQQVDGVAGLADDPAAARSRGRAPSDRPAGRRR